MAIKSAIPYLIVNGRAKEAIALYKTAFQAEVTALQHFGDMDQSCPEANRDLVMHAELRMGSVILFVSDGHGVGPVPKEGAVHVALAHDNEDDLRRIFDLLAVGGKVIQAPFAAPWGEVFCAVDDGFGIGWMMTSPINA